jgi:hypothetical protein
VFIGFVFLVEMPLPDYDRPVNYIELKGGTGWLLGALGGVFIELV